MVNLPKKLYLQLYSYEDNVHNRLTAYITNFSFVHKPCHFLEVLPITKIWYRHKPN